MNHAPRNGVEAGVAAYTQFTRLIWRVPSGHLCYSCHAALTLYRLCTWCRILTGRTYCISAFRLGGPICGLFSVSDAHNVERITICCKRSTWLRRATCANLDTPVCIECALRFLLDCAFQHQLPPRLMPFVCHAPQAQRHLQQTVFTISTNKWYILRSCVPPELLRCPIFCMQLL